jgi:ComF family protein
VSVRIAATAATGLIELLAPGRCPGCDGRSAGSAFCVACAPLLEPIERASAGTPGAAGFVYAGPLADAIVRLKYAGRTDLAPSLGTLLTEAALVHAGLVDRVVPVPLHPARLRARGFNQSALLAVPLAHALAVPLDVSSLARVRQTRDQAGLSRQERSHNLDGAFGARGAGGSYRVLLIDDVRTTGATLAAAAGALTAAGCVEVIAFARARAPG